METSARSMPTTSWLRSPRFKLNRKDLLSIGKSLLLTLGGAALLLLSEALSLIDCPPGSMSAVVAPFVANLLWKWGRDARAPWEKATKVRLAAERMRRGGVDA